MMHCVPILLAIAAATLVPTQALTSADTAALLAAARAGDLGLVRDLLDRGVPVDAGDRYESTALFFAADRGHTEIVALLLERGADPNRQDSFYGMSPIGRSLQGGHTRISVLLLEHGAEGAGQVLFAAIRNGDTELATAALRAGPLPRALFEQARAFAQQLERAEIAQALERAEVFDPPPAAPFVMDPATLPRYAGMFRNDDDGLIVEVEAASETLLLHRHDREPTILEATDRDRFASGDGALEAAFSGRGGTIEFLQLRDGERRVLLRPVDPEEAELIRAGGAAAGGAVLRSATAEGNDAPMIVAPHWPSFRGPGASGIGDGREPPVDWDVASGAGIAWKTPIPGIANASPVVWEDRVFVTTAVSGAGDDTVRVGLYGDVVPVDDLSPHRFEIYALDRRSGEILWHDVTHEGPPRVKRHTKSSQANSTPVTDGERVVVLFGSVGILAAYDLQGRRLWQREIGVLDAGWFYDPDYQWGHASSPILYDDTVIVQADVQGGSFIAAFDLDSGEQLWRTERDEIPTWGSPTVMRAARDEIVTNGTRIRGYDARTGEELWSLGPNSEVVVATPVAAGGLVYVTAGYPPVRPIYAIAPGGQGDISLPADSDTNENIQWSKDRGGTYIPTPIVYREQLYTNANNGRLTAYDAATGEMVYRTRIGGIGASYVASPVAADGRLYFCSEDGTVHVVRAGPEYELLSSNEMGEVIWATPAITDGLLIVRTLDHVWGIGAADRPEEE